MGALRLEDLPHYTYDDYKLWEGRWELIYGIPYAMSPSPIFKHQDISANISSQLKEKLNNCEKCKSVLATDWIVSDDTTVCPDNSVVCDMNENDSFITKVPEIIFEVLSASTKKKDRTIKYELFQEHGVKYYILVEPTGSFAEIYELVNGRYEICGELMNESFLFKVKTCEINFDFGYIFK